jgi:cobalt-zinc-cadmium efflux system protein
MSQPHAHDHAHTHGHNHSHAHAPRHFDDAFLGTTVLNVALVVAQVGYGLSAQSMALIADAGHNGGDALALVLAWIAHVIARRSPSASYTYGFRSASILAALANGMILLIATGIIAWEAFARLLEPVPVASTTVMVVSAVAIAINALSAWLLSGHGSDLNIRGAFLHMVADAVVSFGVVLAAGLILLTGRMWIDPLVSLVISGVIVWSTWGLFLNALKMSMNAVPAGIDPVAVRAYLRALPGVGAVHDIHIWAMSTTETALTCHLVMPGGHPGDAFLKDACHELNHRFRIGHPTIQIELSDAEVCAFEPEHVV